MSPDQVIPVSQQGGRRQVQSGSVRSVETPKDRCKTEAPGQGLAARRTHSRT